MSKSKFSKRQIASTLLLSSTAIGATASGTASAGFIDFMKNAIGDVAGKVGNFVSGHVWGVTLVTLLGIIAYGTYKAIKARISLFKKAMEKLLYDIKVDDNEKLINVDKDNNIDNEVDDIDVNENDDIFNDDAAPEIDNAAPEIYNAAPEIDNDNAAPKFGTNTIPTYNEAKKLLLKYKDKCKDESLCLSTQIGNDVTNLALFMANRKNKGIIYLVEIDFGFDRIISGLFGYYLSQTKSEDESTVLSATRSAFDLASDLFKKKRMKLKEAKDYLGLENLRSNIENFMEHFSGKLYSNEKEALNEIIDKSIRSAFDLASDLFEKERMKLKEAKDYLGLENLRSNIKNFMEHFSGKLYSNEIETLNEIIDKSIIDSDAAPAPNLILQSN